MPPPPTPPRSPATAARVNVRRDIAASVLHTKLENLYERQTGRVVLDVGGKRFYTSRAALSTDPACLLNAMLQPGSPMNYLRMDEFNCPVYYFDRDPTHFRLILNYLTVGSRWSTHVLPGDVRHLYEMRAEAEHYEIKGLVEVLERRIAILSEAKSGQ